MNKYEKLIDLNFYSLNALKKTILDFSEILKVEIHSKSNENAFVKVNISNKNDEKTILEFLNYLCDLTIIEKLKNE